ncbi:MAG: radical SAM protein [Treponemataceae bacterium]
MNSLAWIDDFWSRAGPRIFSREEDGVLILPPNRVYRINSTAASLIAYLKDGGKASLFRLPAGGAEKDVADFFGDLAALYRGEEARNGTVSDAPYDFSFTRLPVLAEIAVTYRCNNACRFCYAGCGSQGADAAAERRHELPTRDLERVIDIFADEARVPFFSFTGGEPLLRNDLERLAAYAKKRALSINLVTNGTLADRSRAASLAKAGISSAQVSIEAPDTALHDSLTGRNGAFDQTVAGIAALRDAGISTQTNTTITRDNLDVAARMPAFLADLGIERFAMNLFIPTVRTEESDRLFVSYAEIGAVVDAVAHAARKAGLTFFWYSPTPFGAFNPIARGLGNKSCAAADGLLSVAPDGSVLPCSSWDESLGNLMQDSFSSIWFSHAAAFYKEKRFAPAACRACASFVACQGACPLYRRYQGLGDADPSPCELESPAVLERSLR